MLKAKYLLWFSFVVFLYFYLSLFRNALIDDAFITLCYVKNVLNSKTWGFLPGYIANSATSPLNVILLTLIGLLTGPTEEAALWLALAGFTFITVLLIHISLRMLHTPLFGYLAASAFIFNPLLISTIGLESVLFVAFTLAAMLCYLDSRWYLSAVSLGMLTLVRSDALLFYAVFLLFVPTLEHKIRFSTAYSICILPWYLFSWIYLGSAVPDTLLIKTAQIPWGEWNFSNGLLLYSNRYPLETALSFMFLPFAVLAVHKKTLRPTIMRIIVIFGITHFIAYSLLEVPPYHWYYIPQLTTFIFFGTFSLGVLYKYYIQMAVQRLIIEALSVVLFLIPITGMGYIISGDFLNIKEMPIHTNWATHDQYKSIALWISDQCNKEGILLSGEIGTLAYYSGCLLSDQFSDRRWLKGYIDNHTGKMNIKCLLNRLNFLFYDDEVDFPPYAYRLTGYRDRADPHIEKGIEWKTSTKWIPNGLVVWSEY